MTQQELDSVNRLVESVRYDLFEQPDNLWILRVRYFLLSILFVPTADFYINWRQYELYSNWLHMDVFTTETSLAEGSIGKGDRGAQFVGPYPPKGTTHTYSVFVFALKDEPGQIPFVFDGGGNSIFKIFDALDTDANGNEGNVLAYGRLDGNFTMK